MRNEGDTPPAVAEGSEIWVGRRGCSAETKRRGRLRLCAQPAIEVVNGRPYCYYHDPRNPKKFGEGYLYSSPPPASEAGPRKER